MKTYFNRIPYIFAAVAALLISANAFAASDYLLEIEGIKGECKGKKFELTENPDGSFTVTNIPGGTYKLVYKPKVVVAGSASVSTSSTFGKGKESLTLEAIVSPRDAASGLPTGKRQHKPFVITKELDKSSPKILTLGEIVVGDLDGDGAVDAQGDPIHGVDIKLGAKSKVNTTNPPENAGKAPVKAGYDLKLNKKV